MNVKHQQFINEYFRCKFNGTKAYRRVYPDVSYDAASVNASKLLRNAKVSAEIKRRMKLRTLSADEVLVRLTEHANGDIADFIGKSVDEIKRSKKTNLIHKLTITKTKTVTEKMTTESETIRLEMYNAQGALKLIGDANGAFDGRDGDDGEGAEKDWYNAADEPS